MRGTRRLLVAGTVALCLSGGCTLLLARTLARRVASQHERMVQYVGAVKPLPAGVALSAADLTLISWPAADPVSTAFKHESDVIGRSTLYPAEAGQPLLEQALTAPGAGSGLASKIPNGMRALALQCDEVVGVAGFLSPGSRVDMLVTYRPGSANEPVTRSVLTDAAVIATGQRTEPDPKGKPITATVVTLLLTPEQSEHALLASSLGSVHFVLRNGGDRTTPALTGATLSDLGAPATAGPSPTPLGKAFSSHSLTSARNMQHNESAPALPETVLGTTGSGPERNAP